MDNYVPGFTSHYNREEQGIVADYVIIMGYDEHFAGSEEAGSVASIDFVREGITETLKEVPKEKVINGLPFFTRLWIESSSGLTSQAIGMQEAETAVANAGVTASWDEETSRTTQSGLQTETRTKYGLKTNNPWRPSSKSCRNTILQEQPHGNSDSKNQVSGN